MLDGITVGSDNKSNTFVFYNPLTRSCYQSPAFWLEEGQLPVTNFPKSIPWDGGLICGLYCDRIDPSTE